MHTTPVIRPPARPVRHVEPEKHPLHAAHAVARRAEPPEPRPPARPGSVAYSELVARLFKQRRTSSAPDPASASPEGGGDADGAERNPDGAVSAVMALRGSSQPAAEIHAQELSFDGEQLRERIRRCLALYSALTHAWSISMRLRADVALDAHIRLSGDNDGRLCLELGSSRPAIVEAMRAEKTALVALLEAWSTSTPRVDIQLVQSSVHEGYHDRQDLHDAMPGA